MSTITYKVKVKIPNDNMAITTAYGDLDEAVKIAKWYLTQGYIVHVKPVVKP